MNDGKITNQDSLKIYSMQEIESKPIQASPIKQKIFAALDAIKSIGERFLNNIPFTDWKGRITSYISPLGSLYQLQVQYIWKRATLSVVKAAAFETLLEKLQPKTVKEKLLILEQVEHEISIQNLNDGSNAKKSLLQRTFSYLGLESTTTDDVTKCRSVVDNVLALQNQRVSSTASSMTSEIAEAFPLQHIILNKTVTNETSATSVDSSKSIISNSFEDTKGDVIAVETCARIGTASILSEELKEKIVYYNEKLSNTKNPEERSRLQKAIARFETQQHNYALRIKRGAWASTNAHRTFFKNHVTEDVGSADKLIPLLTNLRNQTVRNKEGKIVSSINRSGAVTDFGHGEISLQEMQDYRDLKMLKDGKFLTPERTMELRNLYKLGKPIHLKQLTRTLNSIEQNARISYGDRVLSDNGNTIDIAKLDEVCMERTERLTSQVLQELYVHFSNKPVESDKVDFTRVALLNTMKGPDGKNELGKKRNFVNFEKNQALDMKAIYDKFDGKTILFDDPLKHPYPFVDDEGVIHMPAITCSAKGVNSAKLTANFFNISVQGNTRNEGMQKQINAAAVAKMDKRTEKNSSHAKFIKEKLPGLRKGSNTAHETVADIVEELQEDGHYVSIDCYGGKDRTGYVLALITFRKLKNTLPELSNDLVAKWKEQLVGKDGVLRQVIGENTGHLVAKLMALSLALFKPTDLVSTQIQGIKVKLNAPTAPADLYENEPSNLESVS